MVAEVLEKVTGISAFPTPFPLELRVPYEWFRLRFSPIYYGFDRGYRLPRGHGEPVVLVPGLFSTDASMGELFWWLNRMGYTPFVSGIGTNWNCPNISSKVVADTIKRAFRDTHQPVTLVCHSLGGPIAIAAAKLVDRRLIKMIITLGSPLTTDLRVNHQVLKAAKARQEQLVREGQPLSCFTTESSCDFGSSVRAGIPEDLWTVHVFSTTDGVVHYADTKHADGNLNREVEGSHVGLIFNPQVYLIIAKELARQHADRKISRESATPRPYLAA